MRSGCACGLPSETSKPEQFIDVSIRWFFWCKVAGNILRTGRRSRHGPDRDPVTVWDVRKWVFPLSQATPLPLRPVLPDRRAPSFPVRSAQPSPPPALRAANRRWHVQLAAGHAHTRLRCPHPRRPLTRTTAATFNHRRRTLPAVARASAVPAQPMARTRSSRRYASVASHSRSWLLACQCVLSRSAA